jgi:ribosomal protein S18 acetylase RimI-like enzyme
MRVRPAQIADAEAIAAVHVRSWQAAYRGLIPQDYLDRLDPAERQPGWEHLLTETNWPRRGILVVEIDRQVVGLAGLVPARDEDQDPTTVGEIASIYLAPDVWGRGIGKTLMAAALTALKHSPYRQATLWVLDTNARARRFYESTGWRSDGTTKRDDTRGFPLTEIRYRRPLTPHSEPVARPTGR